MMTHSPLTNGVQITSDSSPRSGGIDRFIVHHAATTSLAAILDLFQPGGRTVSANYAMGNDGTLILAVDEDRRAWTSSSAYWDGRAVTIEVANSVAGGSWPVSDASFDKLARLIADVATRYGFPITDDTVLTHQELYIRYGDSYATACPGDLQRRKAELLGKANYYKAFPGGEQPEPEIIDEEDMRVVLNKRTGRTYGVGIGFIKHHANPEERNTALLVSGQKAVIEVDDYTLQRVLFNYGLEEYAFGEAWSDVTEGKTPGKMWIASWLKNLPVPTPTGA